MIVRVLHLDAFAARPGLGNPAGVVLEANGLSETATQGRAGVGGPARRSVRPLREVPLRKE